MTDTEYLNRAEHLLRVIESTCDTLNDSTTADIDNQRTGSMLTLTFANRSQIVINLQKPLHEVWMAAQQGGYHYRWIHNTWRNTKTDEEFFTELSRCASAQAGMSLVFSENTTDTID